ncbi:uncharacterized protein LOC129585806 [Paramacrobiotus metropolitanus]|uniref:uncharacterized protein LOC129585806 n=1 Tax=Paramacrobiotus metropolitanus TaxID=2943436 RepID=UPI0024459ED0|nr:uncharacterized protein LOC129585806 [Paramacrobiotus metropolitanus]
MEISYVFILSSFALLFCITGNGVDGLKCFVCDSVTNPKCGDDPKFDPAALPSVDCDQWCNGRGGYIVYNNSAPASSSDIQRNYPAEPCPVPPQKFHVCRKLKQSVTTKKENNGYAVLSVVRTCGFEGLNSTRPNDYRGVAASKSDVYNCLTDECNTGANVAWSFSITLGFLFVLLVLSF